jgi:hypothetical protein
VPQPTDAHVHWLGSAAPPPRLLIRAHGSVCHRPFLAALLAAFLLRRSSSRCIAFWRSVAPFAAVRRYLLRDTSISIGTSPNIGNSQSIQSAECDHCVPEVLGEGATALGLPQSILVWSRQLAGGRGAEDVHLDVRLLLRAYASHYDGGR